MLKLKISLLVFIIMVLLIASCEKINDLNPSNETIIENISDYWKCNEQSEQLGQSNFDVSIEKDTETNSTIKLFNFYRIGTKIFVYGTINGLTINFSRQEFDSFTLIGGSGKIASDYSKITLNYDIDDGSSDIDHVTAILTPKY